MNIKKLENPARVAELNPLETLKKIGVDEGTVFFDYGAGTGVFSIPACKMTKEKVYAYDISSHMLDAIKQKAEHESIENIVLLDADGLARQIDSIQVDNIMMAAVYHHIDDLEKMFENFARLLKKEGKVSVIEFFYKETPMGPPTSHRVHRQSLVDEFTQHDYKVSEEFELGENFYLISFVKSII
ncbi:MAG: class I SAM-dependent methyltransferase [Eubacteriales bacterium]